MTTLVMGITGNVGGEVARNLLSAGKPVRAFVRDRAKTPSGCETAVGDINDGASLTAAFQGAEAVFILVPPNFDPLPGFPEAHAIAANLRAALEAARPSRVVYLSTIGAQAAHENLLTQHTIIETALKTTPLPITFLRPGWFMENAKWDIPAAREGVLHSFLQPLDKAIPMVATPDIGALAAELLQEDTTGHRVVELEGPHPVSPNDIAASFSELLGHPVVAQAVPRDNWESLFPNPRIQMLDGFNQGWIRFEGIPRKGSTTLKETLAKLVESLPN